MAPSVGIVRFLLRLAISGSDFKGVGGEEDGCEDVVGGVLLLDWSSIISAPCVVRFL